MLYKNILVLCEKRKISVAALEKALGLGNATIRGWEQSSPRLSNVQAVAEYFGCTVDDLIREKIN